MSTTSDSSPVLVVGGGIAGLSTALALSRKGIPVQVIEQAAEFKEIGAPAYSSAPTRSACSRCLD